MGNSEESNRKREGTFPICGKEHWLLFSMLFYSAHSSSNGRSGCSERWEGCKCLRPANDLQLPLRSGNRYLVAMGLLHPFFCILCFFSWRKRFQKYLCHCIMECKKLVLPGFLSLHTGLYYKAGCACSSSSVYCVSGLLNMSLWWPPSISERPVKHGLLDFALAFQRDLFLLWSSHLYMGEKWKPAASLWLI